VELEANTRGEEEESNRFHLPGTNNLADLDARVAPASMLIKSTQLNEEEAAEIKAEEKSIKREIHQNYRSSSRSSRRAKTILNPNSMLKLIDYVRKLSPG